MHHAHGQRDLGQPVVDVCEGVVQESNAVRRQRFDARKQGFVFTDDRGGSGLRRQVPAQFRSQVQGHPQAFPPARRQPPE
jgi:hypothetical protein